MKRIWKEHKSAKNAFSHLISKASNTASAQLLVEMMESFGAQQN